MRYIGDKSAVTLSDKVADMNELKTQINDLRRHREPEEYIGSLQNELNVMINDFGDVPGLHDGIIDPARVTDIKLDGRAVEDNAIVGFQQAFGRQIRRQSNDLADAAFWQHSLAMRRGGLAPPPPTF